MNSQIKNRLRQYAFLKSEILDLQQEYNLLSNYNSDLVDEEVKYYFKVQINNRIDEIKEIVRLISSIEDSLPRAILIKRYLKCQEWKEISILFGFADERPLYRMHKEAISQLELSELKKEK